MGDDEVAGTEKEDRKRLLLEQCSDWLETGFDIRQLLSTFGIPSKPLPVTDLLALGIACHEAGN